jgi:integrase
MTKTVASEREVDLVPGLLFELQTLAAAGCDGHYVFTGPSGVGLDWNNFRQRNWCRLLQTAGVRSRPPYQCRHTFAANLLTAGANPHYVAHQMGHSTLAMVIRHYARWTHKPEREVHEAVVATPVTAAE